MRKYLPSFEKAVETIDSRLLEWHMLISEKWQDYTTKSKDYLATGLYYISSVSFMANFLLANTLTAKLINPLLAMDVFMKAKIKEKRPSQKFVDILYPSVKFSNPLIYAMGYALITHGFAEIIRENFNQTRIFEQENLMGSYRNLAVGLATFSWASGDYISRSDLPNTPEREKETLSEKVKALIKRVLRKPATETI